MFLGIISTVFLYNVANSGKVMFSLSTSLHFDVISAYSLHQCSFALDAVLCYVCFIF